MSYAWALTLLATCGTSLCCADVTWPAASFRRAVFGCDAHNADQMLAQINEVARCGADTAVITGHLNGWAFFPSQLAKPAPDLVVADVLAEGVQRIHDLGMKAVIYVGAPLIQQALADRMQWRQRRSDGQPATDQPAFCILSPFHDWLTQYLVEIATHAPVDGIWLDGYPQPVLACACPHCAQAYRADTGAELPTSADPRSPDLRAYAVWWWGKCEERAHELVSALHAAAPNVALFANCVTGRNADAWRFTPDGLCRQLDGPSVEQFWHVDRQGDPMNVAFAIYLLQAAAHGKPTEVFVPLLPHTVDCTTTLPDTEILARTLTVIANGAVPQLAYGPGQQEPFARAMEAIRQREPYLQDARRERYCGIAASTLTGLMVGRAEPEKDYWEEVRGWLRALTEAHLPVELLSDEQLAAGQLEGLRVVVLASTACLRPEALEAIRRFVADGGGLVATGQVSLCDLMGEPGPALQLEDVLGARLRGVERREPLPSYWSLAPGHHLLAQGQWVERALWRQWSCLGHPMNGVGLPGRCVIFEPAEGRSVAWSHLGGGPAVIAGEYGSGKVVYMGPEVGAAYFRYSYPYLRSLMAESVRWSAGADPPDRVYAPLLVQATYWRQHLKNGRTRRVIHLLNEASSWGRASMPAGAMPLREEVIPMGGVTLELSGPVGRVHLEPEGVALAIQDIGGARLRAELPPLGLHQMVVAEAPEG